MTGSTMAALVSWLAAELLGLYMLRSWLASRQAGPPSQPPAGLSPALIVGHAGLAFTGLLSWVVFVLTGSAVPAWIAVGLLVPAIGLGISTVTVWTPYPARRPPRAGPRASAPAPATAAGAVPATLVSNEMLNRALASEALTSKLVDDLVARMLTEPQPAPRGGRWQLAPLIPVLHGVAALVTVLLAMLAAIAA